MKINSAKIKNYRSILDCDFSFSGSYTAISGKNNAGKSNVLRAIRLFLDTEYELTSIFEQPEETKLDFSEDYPAWEEDVSKPIQLGIDVTIDRELDAGLFRFVTTILGSNSKEQSIRLVLGLEATEEIVRQSLIVVSENEKDSEKINDYFKVQEIHKKLKSSKILTFHNSTRRQDNFFTKNSINLFNEISVDDRKKLGDAQEKLSKALKQIAQQHQGDIKELLGKLAEHYEISITTPAFNLSSLPFIISLGDKNHGVPLESWGSGTQNRTNILLSLLSAKKITESALESDKITPIIMIEEPESFLHPSAQAEFGNILRDLSKEFDVQVLATTHSPYLLSLEQPECNLLLERKSKKVRNSGNIRETYVVDTKGENWMEPFALALGISSNDLESWRKYLFNSSEEIILVEGKIDKEYFLLLQEEQHGTSKLDFSGEIFPYNGAGFFSNQTVLKFLLSRHPRIFITYDQDKDKEVSGKLEKLGLKKGEDFLSIGKQSTGKQDIEGLLPDKVRSAIYAKQADLVAKGMAGDKDARQKLKSHFLEEFKDTASIADGDYADFYSLTQKINKALRKKRK